MILPLRHTTTLFVLTLFSLMPLAVPNVMAQCVRLRDPRNNNLPTMTPKKNFACLAANQPKNQTVLTLQFESNVSNITINWGYRNTIQVVAGPVGQVSYTYPDTGSFTYTITQPGCPTVISGVFLNHYNVRSPGIGFIFPPAGNDNQRCLPSNLAITNSSPGMTPFTEFIVDWGGLNEKRDTVDYRSFNQAIPHLYRAGSKICRTRMTVVYRNLCGLPPGTSPLTQSAGDYYFIDKDSAISSPGQVVICQPEDIILNDASRLHCLDTSGRKIAWQALSGFAAPLGAPVDYTFRTYGNPANKRITIPRTALLPPPADSTYELQLFIRNQCGTDTAQIKIILAQPRKPILSTTANNVCPGQVITFRNDTQSPYPDGVLTYQWDFGDGTPIALNNEPTVEHNYAIGGTYTVTLHCVVKSTVSNTECRKSSAIQINVRRTVTPIVNVSPAGGCDQGLFTIQNRSVNLSQVVWTGWELGNSSLTAGSSYIPLASAMTDTSVVAIRSINPTDSSALIAIKRYGRYFIRLKAQAAGCPEFYDEDTIDVYPSPTIRWHVSTPRACAGSPIIIRDSSIVFATDTNSLPSSFRHLKWEIHMGDTTILRSARLVTQNFDDPVLSNRLTQFAYRQPGSYLIRLRVFANGAYCAKEDTFRIEIQPSPTPLLRANKDRCNNSQVTLHNLTQDSASYYAFEIFKGLRRVATYVRFDRRDHNITMPYVPPGDSTFYQIYLKSFTINGSDTCISISEPYRIGVAPTPVAAFSVSPGTDGCHPMANVQFSNTSFNMAIDSSTHFRWTFGNGQTDTTEFPPAQTYLNPGTVLTHDTVRLAITKPGGCVFRYEREILIFPSPNAQMVSLDSICSGEELELSATGNNLASYNWTFPGYDQSNTFVAEPRKRFTNFSDTALIVNVDLQVKTINNCPQQLTKQIKVFPQPQVDLATETNPTHFCSPLPATFRFTTSRGATQYRWHFPTGDSLITNQDTAVFKLFENTGAAPIQLNVLMVATSGGRCSTSVSRVVTVNPRVEAIATPNLTVACSPAPFMIVNGSPVGADRLTWTIGNQTTQNQQVVSTILSNSSYTRDTTVRIRFIARNSLAAVCADTASFTVTVHPKPVVSGITIPPVSLCSPVNATLSGLGIGLRNYIWDFGDGTSQADTVPLITHSFENFNPTADRTYNVRLIGSNQYGCTDTATRSISVKPYISAGIVTPDTAGCTPFTARLSGAGSVNANLFQWDLGAQGTSNLLNPTFVLSNNSDSIQHIRVRLIAGKLLVQGCPDTAYHNITVYPKPRPFFTIDNTIGCGPLPVSMLDSTNGSIRTQWLINSGGVTDTIASLPGMRLDTVYHNPNLVNKTILVDLQAFTNKGCFANQTKVVTVYADLTATFQYDTAGCTPMRVKIVNTSVNPGGSYLWSLGDGNRSSDRSPEHVYTYNRSGDTTYTIKLTSIGSVGGCSRSDSAKIKVYGRPDVDFTITSRLPLQLPRNRLDIRNTTPFYPNWHYQWTFGDNAPDTSRAQTFPHLYNFRNEDFTDTNFTVRVIARGDFGCADTASQRIIIQPEPPIPEFKITTDSTGCSPLAVGFFNTSTYAREYLWNFGDGSISDERHANHSYLEEGIYSVTLMAKGFGGTRDVVREDIITVIASPRAFFYPSRKEIIIPEEKALFIVDKPCVGCTYDWDFGDSTRHDTALRPLHTYTKTGVYTVCLKVVSPNGCTATYTSENCITVLDDQLILIPNVFKPSAAPSGGYTDVHDGNNAIFYPFTKGAKKIKMQIYNRWGQLVYQSTEIGKGWDGYWRGSVAPSGTYVYRIDVEFYDGEVRKKIGDITLLY